MKNNTAWTFGIGCSQVVVLRASKLRTHRPSEVCQFIGGSIRGGPAMVDWELKGSEW